MSVRQEFLDTFGEIVDVLEAEMGAQGLALPPEAIARVRRCAEYNVPHGKLNRGLAVVECYRAFRGAHSVQALGARERQDATGSAATGAHLLLFAGQDRVGCGERRIAAGGAHLPPAATAFSGARGRRRVARGPGGHLSRGHFPHRAGADAGSDVSGGRPGGSEPLHRGDAAPHLPLQDLHVQFLPAGGVGHAPGGRARPAALSPGRSDLGRDGQVLPSARRLSRLFRRPGRHRQDRHRHRGEQMHLARGGGTEADERRTARRAGGQLCASRCRLRRARETALPGSGHSRSVSRVRDTELPGTAAADRAAAPGNAGGRLGVSAQQDL
eukprot:ctg_1157.g280